MTEQSDTVFEDTQIDTTGTATDSDGNDVVVELEDKKLLGLRIEANGDASYAIDVSADSDRWFDNEVTYDKADQDTTSVSDAFDVASRYLRVRVTEAAAGGSTADIYIAYAGD